MSKIAVIIADMFEDSEYTIPAEKFQEAGHQITHVGLKSGATVKGKKEGTPVTIDKSLDETTPGEYDALLILGGYSPDKLRAHDTAVDFTRAFMEANKPVFAICHGAQLLITADTLKGRKATGWKSVRQDIINAGAEFLDQEVVVDQNLVTSRQPTDIPTFVEESLKKLQ